jgi:hypothetical protein
VGGTTLWYVVCSLMNIVHVMLERVVVLRRVGNKLRKPPDYASTNAHPPQLRAHTTHIGNNTRHIKPEIRRSYVCTVVLVAVPIAETSGGGCRHPSTFFWQTHSIKNCTASPSASQEGNPQWTVTNSYDAAFVCGAS